MTKKDIELRIGELKWKAKWCDDLDEFHKIDKEIYNLKKQLAE